MSFSIQNDEEWIGGGRQPKDQGIINMSSDGEDQVMAVDYTSLAVIAKPLAQGKLHRRLLKLVRKAAKDKTLKRGVKEVVKCIRKNAKG